MPLNPDCFICQAILACQNNNLSLGEKFSWFGDLAVYDIDKAREMVSDGREVFQIETERLAGIVSYTGDPTKFNLLAVDVNENHIDHVSDSQDDPIILGYTLKPRPRHKKDPLQTVLPIDGHNRIARAVKRKQPMIHAFLLTPEESDQIVIDNRNLLRRKRK